MKTFDDTPAALRADVNRLDDTIQEIVKLQHDTRKTLNAALTTQDLLRQRMEYIERDASRHLEKTERIDVAVNSMQTTMSKGVGGWTTLTILMSMVIGAAGFVLCIKQIFGK